MSGIQRLINMLRANPQKTNLSFIIISIYLLAVIVCIFLAFDFVRNDINGIWLLVLLVLTLPWSILSFIFIWSLIHGAGFGSISFTYLLFAGLNSFIFIYNKFHKLYLSYLPREKDLELTESELKLYESLRRIRVNIAIPKGIPSNAICYDHVLQEMARSRPTNLDTLKKVSGVTEEFMKNFGKIFVDEINLYIEDNSRSIQ